MREDDRLSTLAPDLVRALSGRTAVELRAVALALVDWVISKSAVEDDGVVAGLELLRSGEIGKSRGRSRVREFVDELDMVAWDIQDGDPAGEDSDEYSQAFCRARAADCLWAALDEDPLEAAASSAYEAQAATGDVDGMREVVRTALAK